MALRTFRARDGVLWTVWLIRGGTSSAVASTPTEWLAFQNEDCTERRRLFEVPEGWSGLADDRLDRLREAAEPVTELVPRHSPAGGTIQPDAMDDE